MRGRRAEGRCQGGAGRGEERARREKAIHRVVSFLRSFHAFDSMLVLSQLPAAGSREFGGQVYSCAPLALGPLVFREVSSHAFASLVEASDFVSRVQDTHVAALSKGSRNGSNALQLLASGKLVLRLNRATAEHCPLSRVAIGGGEYLVYSDVLEARARTITREENKRLSAGDVQGAQDVQRVFAVKGPSEEPDKEREGNLHGESALQGAQSGERGAAEVASAANTTALVAPKLALPRPPTQVEKLHRVCDWLRELPEFTMRLFFDPEDCPASQLPSPLRSMPVVERSLRCIYALSTAESGSRLELPGAEIAGDLMFDDGLQIDSQARSQDTGSAISERRTSSRGIDGAGVPEKSLRGCSLETVLAVTERLNSDPKAPRKICRDEYSTALGADDIYLSGYAAGKMLARFAEQMCALGASRPIVGAPGAADTPETPETAKASEALAREPPAKRLPPPLPGPRTLFCFTTPTCPPFTRWAIRPKGDAWVADSVIAVEIWVEGGELRHAVFWPSGP